MKQIIFTLFLFTIFHLALWGQETKRVYFIGNSYTYVNDLPVILNSLANANSDTVLHASSTPGGAQLVQHVANTTTLNGIRQGNWDYVVVQEQSQKPSFSPTQVANQVLPYAAQLHDSIAKYNPCGETVFFMTWGRKNGDASNCASYPPLCTYDGMQDRLRSSYLLMAQQNEAICSPVGAAWKVARDSFPNIELYSPDESHPSYAGSYLAACTFYATIFRKSPIGLNFYGSLSQVDAEILQNIASIVVLDSLSNWFIGHDDIQADFVSSVNLDSVSFDNNSSNAINYSWDFGDNSPTSTVFSPTHLYNSVGSYSVVLIASDSCGNSDTSAQQIMITIVTNNKLLPTTSSDFDFNYSPNPSDGFLRITSNQEMEVIEVLNLLGQQIFYQKNLKSEKFDLLLNKETKGTYIIKIKSSSGLWTSKKLVLQ